jgi:hypothetical protein
VVEPGATASFLAAWVEVPTDGDDMRGCPASAYAHLTPPDETDHLTLPISINACAHGAVFVTAMVAGSDGPSQ